MSEEPCYCVHGAVGGHLVTPRCMALRGQVVRVSEKRLLEMQAQAIRFEGITGEPVYHWHFAAALNELAALRKIVAEAARIRGINLTPNSGETKP
jgi:hypothetical protein